jgi:hypothetical protein
MAEMFLCLLHTTRSHKMAAENISRLFVRPGLSSKLFHLTDYTDGVLFNPLDYGGMVACLV